MASGVSSSTVVAPRMARRVVDIRQACYPGASGRARPPGRPPAPGPVGLVDVAGGHGGGGQAPDLVEGEGPVRARGAGTGRPAGPIRVRTSRTTGWPTASHMRRTWRLRPSWMTMRSSDGATTATRAGAVDPVLELHALAQARARARGRAPPPPGPGTPWAPRRRGG